MRRLATSCDSLPNTQQAQPRGTYPYFSERRRHRSISESGRTPALIARPSTGAHASTVQRPSTPREARSSESHLRLAHVRDVPRIQKQPREPDALFDEWAAQAF